MADVDSVPLGTVANSRVQRLFFHPRDDHGSRSLESGVGADPDASGMWDVAVRLADWQIAGDVTGATPSNAESASGAETTLEGAVQGGAISSACIRIGAHDAEANVLVNALDVLADLRRWAIVLGITRCSIRDVARLAADHHLFLLDRRLGHLVGVPSANPRVIGELLGAGWLESREALLVSSAELVVRP